MVRMGVVRDVARVQGSQAKVLDFLANFENVASWDPGVKTAQRIGTGTDIGVGTAFDVLCLSQGDEIPFMYVQKKPPIENFLDRPTLTLRNRSDSQLKSWTNTRGGWYSLVTAT